MAAAPDPQPQEQEPQPRRSSPPSPPCAPSSLSHPRSWRSLLSPLACRGVGAPASLRAVFLQSRIWYAFPSLLPHACTFSCHFSPCPSPFVLAVARALLVSASFPPMELWRRPVFGLDPGGFVTGG